MRTQEFLALLFGAFVRGFVVFTALPSRRVQAFEVGPAGFQAAEHWALGAAGAQQNVYIGMGLQSAPPEGTSRGTAATVVGVPGVWADVDIAAPHRPAHALPLPPTRVDAWDLIFKTPGCLPPTVVVDSGWGYQSYCLTTVPWLINSENREVARRAVDGYQSLIIAEAGRHGWHQDRTSDLARIMRLPGDGMWNFKVPANPRPVQVVWQFGNGGLSS